MPRLEKWMRITVIESLVQPAQKLTAENQPDPAHNTEHVAEDGDGDDVNN